MTRAQTTALLSPALGWLALFLLLPCLLLVLNAVLGDDGQITGERFAALFAPQHREVLLDSLRLAGLATLFAFLLGCPAAWAIALSPRRSQSPLLVLILLPFFSSTLFRTYGLALLLGEGGPIPAALQAAGLADTRASLLGQPWTVVVGLVYTYVPFVVLAVYVSLRRQDPALLEASVNLGASRWRSFRRISLPLSVPGMLRGGLFVFALSLGSFLVPDLLAGRAVPTIGTEIYDRFVARQDWPGGSALASLAVGAMLLLLLAQSLLAAREGRGSLAGGRVARR